VLERLGDRPERGTTANALKHCREARRDGGNSASPRPAQSSPSVTTTSFKVYHLVAWQSWFVRATPSERS
jgi:hypothetical protein